MTCIILIRPGSTDYDRQGRIQGTLDIPLNEQGNAEVARVAEELRNKSIDVMYSPDCQPAMQTAELLAKELGIKLKKFDPLQNVDHGLWQGMQLGEVKRKFPKVYRQWQEQPESVCPPYGEMLSQAEDRVQAAVVKLLKKHKKNKNTAIGLVVSEPMASLVSRHLQRGGSADLWKAIEIRGWWEVLEPVSETLAP